MNKKIKELRERAWTLVSDEERERGELYETREQWELCDEKFAELIVKECVLQCNEALVPYTGQPSMTHNYAVGLCQDKIKEHFGVEE